MGGKDAASPRYIFTRLEPVTRTIFHPADDELLNYLEDDGLSIEPEYYVPVIPLVLVNGSDGIGTGWSSTIPNYCPRAIINALRLKIRGEAVPELYPNYYGFTGSIKRDSDTKYTVEGRIERVDDNTLLIDELPIKKWTQDYKVFLEGLLHGDEKKKQESVLKDIRENHTDTTVSFTLTADPAKIAEFEKSKGGLMGYFKLSTSLSTANMHLFDTTGHISKYKTAEDILNTFYDIRLDFYVKRKALLVDKLGRDKRQLDNKARFVEEVCNGDLVVSNRKRKEILAELKERGYELFPPNKSPGNDAEENEEQEEEDNASDADLAKGYEYLLGMKIWSLTFEKAQKLRELLAEKTKELEDLQATEPSQIWLNDLQAIEDALDDRDKQFAASQRKEEEARDAAQKKQGAKKKTGGRKKAAPKKKAPAKKKKDEWDSDAESDDDKELDVVKVVKSAASRAGKPAATKAKPAATKVQPAKSVLETPTSPVEEKKDDSEGENVPGNKKRKESPVKLTDTDSEKEDEVAPPLKKGPTKKAPPKKAAAKKKAIEMLEDTSDEDEAEQVPKKRAPAKKAPAKKRVANDSDSEDFGNESSDSEPEVVAAPPPRARGQRTRKPVASYQIESDSEEEDDDEYDE